MKKFVKIPHPLTILLSATAFDVLKEFKQKEKNYFLDHVSDTRIEMSIQFDADKEGENQNLAKNFDRHYIFVKSDDDEWQLTLNKHLLQGLSYELDHFLKNYIESH